MGIYIPNVEMPKERSLWLCIKTDGTVYNIKPVGIGMAQVVGTAVSLPEKHGRLIDADALIDALETQDYSSAPDTLEDWTPQDMTAANIADITHAPTIVPAEGGGEECSEN